MLDFIRDIYASFRQTSLERVKSPFLGAFVFSWLAFNWPMLAILFFSKKDIEDRILAINKDFDIGNYLLGPVCTSALIAFLLPQINKLITKIQDKPNSETIELTLLSKINIAEKQQQLADIEARKKLAEKKEERNIEEGIYRIKEDLKESLKGIENNNSIIENLQKRLNDSKIEESKLIAQVQAESHARLKSEQALAKIQSDTLSLQEGKRHIENELIRLENHLVLSEREVTELKDQLSKTKSMTDHANDQIMILAQDFPGIFEYKSVGGMAYLIITERAKKALPNVNKTLMKGILDSKTENDFSSFRLEGIPIFDNFHQNEGRSET